MSFPQENDQNVQSMKKDHNVQPIVHPQRYLFLLCHWDLSIMVNITTNMYHCIFCVMERFTFGHYSSHVQQRDTKKMEACKNVGVTLITVPYWWDRTMKSIATAVQLARPDIKL